MDERSVLIFFIKDEISDFLFILFNTLLLEDIKKKI